jgi:hypothetical protein
MAQKELSELSDEELLKTAKLYKSMKIYDAVIVGFLFGIAIYNAANKGSFLITILPLFYIPMVGKNNTRRKEIFALLEERNLEL